MFKNIVFLFFFFLCSITCNAQENWMLKKNQDGIKIFSRKNPGSKINILKVTCEFDASLSQLVAVILDIPASDQWQYNTKNFELVKLVSPSELYYYAEISFPWPVMNRDFVSRLTVSQDSATKKVFIDAINVMGMVPLKSNKIRIKESVGKWIITPLNKSRISVEYILQVDLGGSLPAALINPLADIGPLASFKKLRSCLIKPQYLSAIFPFIKN